MSSVRAVDWVLLDPAASRSVQVGDRLSVDAGGMPIYRVKALAEDGFWLEDGRHPPLRIASLDAFRWKARTEG
ncbi:MAG: hypothetical protein Q8M88_14250 [Phenylobacterium sp.]|uniref:hypothetical protein n=1 Tax=Phenylobacterium sp. TaxID=1871053 RepID=UPI0027327F4C|nr:hypothetical protein [Phenylobacterium sp.]MDP3175590.1 hypothetical protein [Phenylobacterium sp.]